MTNRQLVAAAVEVLERDGYTSGRVEDIAQTAGTSRATFYLHFDSKADVVSAVMERLAQELEGLFHALAEIGELTPEALRGWLDDAITFWDGHAAEALVVSQAVAIEPALAADALRSVQRCADQLRPHLERLPGGATPAAQLRCSLLVMQLERFCTLRSTRGWDIDREAVLTALTDLWVGALGPEGPS